MKSAVCFLFVVLALSLTSAQLPPGFQDLVVIDEFSVTTRNIIIQTDTDSVYPIVQTTSTQAAGIFGGERDIQLTVLSGAPNLVMSSGVASGVFQCSTPNEARGTSTVQWDGLDGSFDLNVNGLGGDILALGATALRGQITSDLPTEIQFRIYSGSVTAVCTTTLAVPGGDTAVQYIIQLSEFTQGCDFSNVGAVELVVEMRENVDVLIDTFTVYGPIPSASSTPTPAPSQSRTPTSAPSPSRTPTPAPSPSRTPSSLPSNSPTPSSAPSISRTPSQTPTPSFIPSQTRTPSNTPTPSDRCVCICPAFTCDLRVDLTKRFETFSFYDTSILRETVSFPTPPTFTQGTFTVPTFTVPTFTIPTFTIPTFTVPTFTVPTFTQGTFTIPTFTIPTVSLPTVSQPTFSFTNSGNSNSDASLVQVSVALIAFVVAMI